ncbi:MAG: tetratricopeptide repeat protein, partial [Isosphaeraceae bacterium]
MRRPNITLLAILVVGMALLGGGMHLVHGFQMRRNADKLLARAHRAEDANELDKVDEVLGHYLSLRAEDAAAWAWYARVVDRRDTSRTQVTRSYLVFEQALRRRPTDRNLKRRCAELAMELGRDGDARRLLNELLERAETDAEARERAELEDLLGQCEESLGKNEDARRSFARAIEHDPHRVDAFDRLARLLRAKLRQDEQADAAIRDMIARNEALGR